MIELPEALTLGRQCQAELTEKTVSRVLPPSSPHRFCFFTAEPAYYDALLSGRSITEAGGRDTERDLFGKPGGYVTWLSKFGMARGCPVCGGLVRKEAYLGGAVYFCPQCQKLLTK